MTNRVLLIPLLISILTVCSIAQEDEKGMNIYAVTLSTGYTHTGMKMPLSGLFRKVAGQDTAWEIMGRPNNRGYNVDFFRPGGGKAMAMATHTGVHQSWDQGKSWKVTSGWEITEVNSIAFSPTNKDLLYCGSPYGFYKTVDGGATWIQKNSGLNSVNANFVTGITIDSDNENIIYCTTEDGIYKSDNTGESWSRMALHVPGVRILVQHPLNSRIFYAGTEDHGLHISTDRGQNWEKSDSGLMQQTIYAISFDPEDEKVAYAGGFQTGVYKTVNSGETWKQYFSGLSGLDIHAIVVMPGHSQTLYAGTMGHGVFRSDDGGKSWTYAGIGKGFVLSLKIESF